VRRWYRRGAKRGRKPKERTTHQSEPGEGKTGRVNASESSAKASSKGKYPESMGNEDGELGHEGRAVVPRRAYGHPGPGE